MSHVGVAQLLGSIVDGLAYSESSDEGNVFVDALPSSPDRCVAVYSTGGKEPDSKLPYDPADFKVVVRSDASRAWAIGMAAKVYSALHGYRQHTLPDGSYVVFILATQGAPFRLGDDENGRPAYSVNFRSEILNPTTERA